MNEVKYNESYVTIDEEDVMTVDWSDQERENDNEEGEYALMGVRCADCKGTGEIPSKFIYGEYTECMTCWGDGVV